MKLKLSAKIRSSIEFLKFNYRIILLIIAFFIGITAGSFLFSGALQSSKDILNQFSQSLTEEQSKLSAFINCTTVNLFYYIVILFSGLSIAGPYILYIVPFVKGLTYGYTSCFIYSIFGVNGLLINIMGILPQTVAVSLLLVFGCKTAIGFSKKVLTQNKEIKIRQFVIIQIILFGISLLISLADVFITNAVITLFA